MEESVQLEYVKLMMDNNIGSDFEDEDEEPGAKPQMPTAQAEGGLGQTGQMTGLSNVPGSETQIFGLQVVPAKYRSVFNDFTYFNIVQSKVIPALMEKENSIAVCAPTGSGKTVLFELAMINLLDEHDRQRSGFKFSGKIIYISPLKAICNERFKDWQERLAPVLGLDLCEITGDTDKDETSRMHRSQLIITTPEKWDSLTRRWKDSNQHLMLGVKLVLIDEVHLLSDPNRGSCLEAVVTRIKMAHKSNPPRILAVSATAPNIKDVAEWLGTPQLPAVHFLMSTEYRPVKLETHVLGFPANEGQNEYMFDANLNFKVGDIIQRYSDGKPALIFCMTRKGVADCAKKVFDNTPFIQNHDHQALLSRLQSRLNDNALKDLVLKAIAFYHSGMEQSDRAIVEEAFRGGIIRSLFSTSSLSMGVNLPAHLVIIKGTKRYIQGNITEYDESEIHQMTGRAGRPQFDERGVAVIMTRNQDKNKFDRLVRGERFLESILHQNLAEHLNAEIVLKTITDVQVAINWLKSTFFYIRCLQNPRHYGMDAGSSKERVGQMLKNLCIKELNGLAKYGMTTMDEDGVDVSPTQIGTLMAHYYISYDTMRSFTEIKKKTFMRDVLLAVCSSKELKQDIQLRMEDKKFLWSFHDVKDASVPNVRYTHPDKIRVAEQKVFTLVQLEFGMIQNEGIQKYRADINRLLRDGQRVSRCLADYVSIPAVASDKGMATTRNAIILAKIFKRKIWETSPHIMKQMEGIGPKLSQDLVSHGITSFMKLLDKDPRELEGYANRHPPFGNNLLQFAASTPNFRIQVYQKQNSLVEVEVTLKNLKEVKQNRKVSRNFFWLLVGIQDQILKFEKIAEDILIQNGKITRKVLIPETENPLILSLLTEYVGMDHDRVEFYLQKAEELAFDSARDGTVPGVQGTPQEAEEVVNAPQVPMRSRPAAGDGPRATLPGDKQECNHSCDKTACKHRCCKEGVKRKAPKRAASVLASSNVSKQIKLIQEKRQQESVAHSAATDQQQDEGALPDVGF